MDEKNSGRAYECSSKNKLALRCCLAACLFQGASLTAFRVSSRRVGLIILIQGWILPSLSKPRHSVVTQGVFESNTYTGQH